MIVDSVLDAFKGDGGRQIAREREQFFTSPMRLGRITEYTYTYYEEKAV